MPLPLFSTEMVPVAASMSISNRSMLGSRCLLSAALTTISSNILYRPGVYVTSRCLIRLVVESKMNMGWVIDSVEPMYVSGRRRMCCVCHWEIEE